MKWRVIKRGATFKDPPWEGAVGIEEDDEHLAVPATVCWFTRGWDDPHAMAEEVVRAHNEAEK